MRFIIIKFLTTIVACILALVQVDVDSWVAQLVFAAVAVCCSFGYRDCGVFCNQLYGGVRIDQGLSAAEVPDGLAAGSLDDRRRRRRGHFADLQFSQDVSAPLGLLLATL